MNTRQRRLELLNGSRRFFLVFFWPCQGSGFDRGKAMNAIVTPIKSETLVVIGNGMVGHHCVEQLIERGALAHYHVHVFGEERQRAYDRVHLSEYFGGRDAESLALGDADLYARHGVQLHLGVQVLEIDREHKE